MDLVSLVRKRFEIWLNQLGLSTPTTKSFNSECLVGYETRGEVGPRPKGIKTYEMMAIHKEQSAIDQEKRWEYRRSAEKMQEAIDEHFHTIRTKLQYEFRNANS